MSSNSCRTCISCSSNLTIGLKKKQIEKLILSCFGLDSGFSRFPAGSGQDFWRRIRICGQNLRIQASRGQNWGKTVRDFFFIRSPDFFFLFLSVRWVNCLCSHSFSNAPRHFGLARSLRPFTRSNRIHASFRLASLVRAANNYRADIENKSRPPQTQRQRRHTLLFLHSGWVAFPLSVSLSNWAYGRMKIRGHRRQIR